MACGLSSCSSWAIEHELNSGDAQAYLLCAMWDLPGSGIKPLSPALAGRFFTTGPPGKPSNRIFSFNLNFFFQWSQVLQITLLALDSLKVLPVGGYVPFGYLCSCVPSSLVRNMGSRKEDFVRKDTLVLALGPAADA